MSTQIDRCIARLMAVYGEPKTPDPDLFVVEFRKALSGWSAEVLDKAVDRWMKSDSAFWPRPGQIVAECNTVAAELARYKPREAEHVPFDAREKPTDPNVAARVNAMVTDLLDTLRSRETIKNPPADWTGCAKPEFDEMQATSRNKQLHQPKTLSPLSKRITGEREDA